MAHAHSCGNCGGITVGQSLDGLCGRCLAAVAFTRASSEEAEATAAADALESLNKTIVLDTAALVERSGKGGRFGDYELISEIARGGMGVIYKARQLSLNRIVAVKMILHARFNNPQFVRRFRAEAEAAANLRHPNIVGIYDIGEQDGQHYFAMEYVEGHDLASIVHEQPLAPIQAAEHVKAIAEAIHYAHQRGILHRDLKPSNVLVDGNGEVRITDFGLAKRVPAVEAGSFSPDRTGQGTDRAEEMDITVSGQVMGSPNYMSPEQAAGKNREVDARSDVYALGAILYTLLSGRPPFMAATIETTLLQVMQAEPVSLRLINPRTPRDLDTVCLKCLQKEPHRRYESAQEVADELGRFLRHEPIRAVPTSAPAKAWRWCRRNPKLAAVTALAITALLVISFGSPFVAYRLNAARILAEKRELAARHNAYAADMSVVYDAIQRLNFAHALHILGLHRPRHHEPDLRGWEWRYFWQQCQSEEVSTLARHSNEVAALTVSRQGQWMGSRDVKGIVKIIRVGDGVEVLTRDAGHGPAPAFSPDESVAAIADGDGQVQFIDLNSQTRRAGAVHHPAPVRALAFTPDGQQLATLAGGVMRMWDWAAGREVSQHPAPIANHAKMLPDARGVIVSDDNRHARIWTIDAGPSPVFDSEHTQTGGKLFDFCVSSDGQLAATASALTSAGGHIIKVWDMKSGREITRFPAHKNFINHVSFSPGGRYLASSSIDQTTCIWDTKTWRQAVLLKGHNAAVSAAAFLPDERTVITGGADSTVKTWTISRRGESAHRVALNPLTAAEMISQYRGSISPDQSMMAMIIKDGTGTLVDLRAMKVAKEFAMPFSNITRVALSPGGAVLACARRDGVVSLSDMQTLAPLADLPLTSTQVVGALTFSRDGKWLAGRGANGAFQLWNVTMSRELPEWRTIVRRATGLCFSPDDRTLAAGHSDGSISIWNIATGRHVATLRGHVKAVIQISFSNDGRLIGSTSHDGTARVWDVSARTQRASFPGSDNNFFRVSFSPDGSRLLVNDWEDTVFFDVAAQRQLVRIKSFTPYFIDENTLLGMGRDELWVYRSPTLQDLDVRDVN